MGRRGWSCPCRGDGGRRWPLRSRAGCGRRRAVGVKIDGEGFEILAWAVVADVGAGALVADGAVALDQMVRGVGSEGADKGLEVGVVAADGHSPTEDIGAGQGEHPLRECSLKFLRQASGVSSRSWYRMAKSRSRFEDTVRKVDSLAGSCYTGV